MSAFSKLSPPNPVADSTLERPAGPKLAEDPAARVQTAVKRPPQPTRPVAGTVWALEAVFGTGEVELSRLARLQHGCAHRYQLDAAGISRKAVARRIQNGRFVRLHVDVILIRPSLGNDLTQLMAAVLQLRGNGIISGLSAARMWDIWGQSDPPQVEVTLVGSELGRPPGLRVRRRATLPSHEIRRRQGVPLTSPSRTLLDLAAVLTPLELEAALASARRRRLVRDTEIRRTLASAPPGTPGIARLRALVDSDTAARDTRSEYERKLLRLIELAELPRPVTNVTVAGHMVDLFWPDARLVVEFDSWTFHGDRHAFETDRRRDQDLAVHGLRVTRLTANQIDDHQLATVARLAGALAGALAALSRA